MSVLSAIQEFTAELFTSDSGNWAYVHDIAETINPEQLRALISTLQQKGVLLISGTDDGNYVEIKEGFYFETGRYTSSGSPEIEFTNIKLK